METASRPAISPTWPMPWPPTSPPCAARNLSWARSSTSAVAIASACSTWSPRSTGFWEQTSNLSFKTRVPATSATRWPAWTGSRRPWATNRSSRSRRDCDGLLNRWSARPANHRVLTPGSRRAEAREVANRRLGDGCRARPDEEEKGLPGPALGRLGAEEPAPFPRGQVGLGGPQNQGVGLGPNLAGRICVPLAPRAGHERRPRLLPGLAENIDGIRELEPVGSQTSESAQCGACLSQRQGRGLQPRGSDRAGLCGEVSAWARKQVSLAHPNVFQDDLGRARGLQRGQLERRANGQARPVDRQGDQHLPPVVQERPGDQDVCALGRGDPGHGPIELKCPGPTSVA